MADPQQASDPFANLGAKPVAVDPFEALGAQPVDTTSKKPTDLHPIRETIRAVLDVLHAGNPDGTRFGAYFPTLDEIQHRVLPLLPAAGGAVGGLLGAPAGPVGAVSGAALGGATGRSIQRLTNQALGEGPDLSGQTPAQASASAAGDVGTQAAIQGASEGVGAAVKPVLGRMAGATMQAAVKPGIKATARAIARGVSPEDLPIVKTLLQEGVNVSPGGINKLTDIISASDQSITDALNNAGVNAGVDPAKVAARVDALATRPGIGVQATPQNAMDAVQTVKQQFLDRWGTPSTLAQAQQGIPLTTAQAIKQGTYQAMKDTAYGAMTTPQIEAQKALALGLKEEIEKEAAASGVDIGAQNARQGAAIVARDAIAKRLAAAGNRDPAGLAWLAHNPTTALLYIAERSPAVKSMLARGMYDSAAKASGIPANVIRLAVTGMTAAQSPDGGS